MGQAIQFIKKLIHQIQADDCQGMAAEMAYNLLLASAPSFIFLFTLLGLVGAKQEVFTQVMYYSQRFLPDDAIEVFSGLLISIVEGSSGGLALLSFLAAFWAASNGAQVILKALNRAYGYPEESSFFRKKKLAVFILLSLGLTLFVASNLIIFGDLLLAYLGDMFQLGGETIILVSVLRWVLVILTIILFTSYVYSIVPGARGQEIPWKRTLPGSLVFAFLWIVVSLVFSLYVENMGRYNQVYGALGAVIVLMVWIFMSSFVLLVGGEVNAVLAANQQHRTRLEQKPA